MIVAENLTKYYGADAAISEVSFAISEGEVVGLLGLNGAGKTTTMRILSGLVVPTAGRVEVAGLDMAASPEAVRSRIGFLPETPPLYGEMEVEPFLRFVGRIKGIGKGIDAAVSEAMEATDLLEVRRQRIDTLSHGFRRRVGIAQAIVHKPALILLDEPTSGLDPVQVVQMRKLVRRLGEQHTLLVSSHVLSEVRQICDRILLLHHGKLVADGTERELAGRVTESTTVLVEVRGSASALSDALGRAKSVQQHRLETDADGVATARVDLVGDSREDLARALIEQGLGLRRLERVQLELESIFLRLTESEHKEVRA